jgi:uncharacterized repeat protein (TIGR03803 family)
VLLASICVLTFALAGHAQTFKVIHNFGQTADGTSPFDAVVGDGSGNLYGVTFSGPQSQECFGQGCGTAFKLSPNTDGTWSETILYEFQGGSDGFEPVFPVILDPKGNVYGTTQGIYPDIGIVFELVRNSDGTYTKQTLHAFSDPMHQLEPYSLTWDGPGRILGTTVAGGQFQLGGVFQLGRASALNWYEREPFDFSNNFSVAGPLLLDGEGTIYGASFSGGDSDNGAIFKLSSTDGLNWDLTVLYSFAGGTDGVHPYAGLIFDQQGNLYGTTLMGGSAGLGTVFELMPTADGGWSESVLYTFQSIDDGFYPYSGVSFDLAGNLYGVTVSGGENNGRGIVFELTRSPGGGWSKQAIHTFTGPDGDTPYNVGRPYIDSNGNIFGTALVGGSGRNCNNPQYGCGVVWEISP